MNWISVAEFPCYQHGVKSDVNFIFILELLKKYVLYLYHIIWKHNMFHCCCCCCCSYDITGGGSTLYLLLEISQNVSEFWKVTYMVLWQQCWFSEVCEKLRGNISRFFLVVYIILWIICNFTIIFQQYNLVLSIYEIYEYIFFAFILHY